MAETNVVETGAVVVADSGTGKPEKKKPQKTMYGIPVEDYQMLRSYGHEQKAIRDMSLDERVSLVEKYKNQILYSNGYTREKIKALPAGQRDALAYLYWKRGVTDTRTEVAKQIEQLDLQRKKLERERREADERLSKSVDTEKIIIAMAGLPTPEENNKNRLRAIDAYFDLLNMFKSSDEQQTQHGKKRTFAELYNKVAPVEKLFEYVRQSASYDDGQKALRIDGRKLYSLVKSRLKEQEDLKRKAQAEFDRLRLDVDKKVGEKNQPKDKQGNKSDVNPKKSDAVPSAGIASSPVTGEVKE